MSATPEFIVGAEGLDIYAAGAIGSVFPWFLTNSTYQGTVVAQAGAFNGNALSFAAAASNQCGTELQFPSTMQLMRSASAGAQGVVGVSGWIQVGTPVATGDTDILLALGTSANDAQAFPLLGVTNTTSGGLSLVLPSTTANLTTAPHLLSITAGQYIWIGVYFSYAPTGVVKATLCLNGQAVFTDQTVTFATDIFSAGEVVNRLRFYAAQTAPWMIDDVIVQAVSNADTIWPAVTTLTPELIPQFTPRQIALATATGNGSVDQFTASGSEPNWQSATDPTGNNSVVATAVNQTDLYAFSTTLLDIKGLVYRGQSSKYNQLTAVQLPNGGTQANMGVTMSAPNEFIGITENDGTNPWTAASIAAAGLGQTSHY